jgi:hypothetical protein
MADLQREYVMLLPLWSIYCYLLIAGDVRMCCLPGVLCIVSLKSTRVSQLERIRPRSVLL